MSTSGNVCREFATLVEANAVAQLPESDFEVDPGLRDIIEAQIKQEEEAVCQVLLHMFADHHKNQELLSSCITANSNIYDP